MNGNCEIERALRLRRWGYRLAALGVLAVPWFALSLVVWEMDQWSCADAGTEGCYEAADRALRSSAVQAVLIALCTVVGLVMVTKARSGIATRPDQAPRSVGPSTLIGAALLVGLAAAIRSGADPEVIWFGAVLRNGRGAWRDLVLHGLGVLAYLTAWSVRADLRFWRGRRSLITSANRAMFVAAAVACLPGTVIWVLLRLQRRSRGQRPPRRGSERY